MNVLALDTASPEPGVSVLARGEIFEEGLPADRHASEQLLSAISRCLARAGMTLAECDRIAVCSGPGSFTGLRVGLSTAWGLGRALEVPVEGISTLEGMAEAARPDAGYRVTAVLDAGRGEVVVESFSLEGSRARSLSPPRRLPREEASSAQGPLICLPGDLLGPRGHAPTISVSRAVGLAVAGEPRESVSGGDSLRGIYSRPSAAEEKRGAP
jgi:tRNA threonylcarbamoyl adenosine modification protein YeaZ